MSEKYLGAFPSRDPFPGDAARGAESVGTVDALGIRVSRLTSQVYILREEITDLHQKLFGASPRPIEPSDDKLLPEPQGEYPRLVQKTADLEKALEQCYDTFTNFRAVFQ